MYRLRNPLRRYAWGSPDRLARFLGVEPDGTPQAELWLGAHPSAPSEVCCDGRWVPLPDCIAADPLAMVGPLVLQRFGPQLPFLLKVLAAAEPLSLQVHPDAVQARAGFEREQTAGLALDDPRRSYRDPNPKPELLCAVDGFDVLSGFRPPGELAEVLAAFGLDDWWVGLAAAGDPLRLCGALWDSPAEDRRTLTTTVVAAAAPDGPADRAFPREAALVRRVDVRYPGDIGVVVALCLRRLWLAPGEAMFAGAGLLHAYLDGFGVELMANSDNVVRAGLTDKWVDVAELRRLLVADAGDARPLAAVVDERTGATCYPVRADEFALSVFGPTDGPVPVRSPGPEILLCGDGTVRVTEVNGTADGGGIVHELGRSDAVFVPACCESYRVESSGTLYRATVGVHAHRPG